MADLIVFKPQPFDREAAEQSYRYFSSAGRNLRRCRRSNEWKEQFALLKYWRGIRKSIEEGVVERSSSWAPWQSVEEARKWTVDIVIQCLAHEYQLSVGLSETFQLAAASRYLAEVESPKQLAADFEPPGEEGGKSTLAARDRRPTLRIQSL